MFFWWFILHKPLDFSKYEIIIYLKTLFTIIGMYATALKVVTESSVQLSLNQISWKTAIYVFKIHSVVNRVDHRMQLLFDKKTTFN